MKRGLYFLLIVGALGLLGGCGTAMENEEPGVNQMGTVDTTSSKEETSRFVGTLSKDIEQMDDQEGTIRLELNEIEVINDPENIGSSFKTNGVILNAGKEQIDGDLEQYSQGQKVLFILQKTPIMTMSIPPQIPGRSIEQIEIHQ